MTLIDRLRNLTLAQRFMISSFIVLVLGMLGVGSWVTSQIEESVIQHAGATTALYLDSFVAPILQTQNNSDRLTDEQIATLDNLLANTQLGKHIVAFKVWHPSGRILYSDDPALIGRTLEVHEGFTAALQGQVTSKVSNLDEPENASLKQIRPRLLETYSPILLNNSSQILAVAEFYEYMDDLEEDIGAAQRESWVMVGVSMILIYLGLAIVVRQASNMIVWQQAELNSKIKSLSTLLEQNVELHERVRRAAASSTVANEHFLRRIGADLHDGPAQELGLALLKMDTVLEDIGTQPRNEQISTHQKVLDSIQEAMRTALQEIRSISSGLSLPELNSLSLSDVIIRVVRTHERKTGSRVLLEMDQIPDEASMPVKVTVYRLIQEALNNAFNHGGGKDQTVTVKQEMNNLMLTIYDGGSGFNPTSPTSSSSNGHLGLSGMRERVESLGGIFGVETAEGLGTTIKAQISLKANGGDHG